MKRSMVLLLCLVLSLAIGLTACNLESKGPICDPATIGLLAVGPSYRNPFLDLSTYTFQWDFYYPEDGSHASCDIESQYFRMGHRSFTEDGEFVYDVLAETDLDGAIRSYAPGVTLEPGGHYYFEITWYGEGGETENSQRIPFNTGPICDRDELLPPLIISVPDGAVVEEDALLSWMYQGGCTPESVEAQLSSSPSFSTPDTEIYNFGYAFHGLTGFIACREYFWRVASIAIVAPTDIPMLPESDFPYSIDPIEYTFRGYIHSEFTEVRSFYVTGDACPIAPPEFGPTIPDEIRTPPRVRVMIEANCRSGPTLDYPVLAILPENSEFDIIGRNEAGDSWLVLNPEISVPCWVYEDWVEVSGDTSQVEEVVPAPPDTASPTDTPEAFNCAQYNNDWQACQANSNCRWDPNGSPNSPCVSK